MYFFRSIIIILMIIITSIVFYKYLKNNINKKNIILISLAFIHGLFVLFSDSIIFLIFLDFSCFLGYMLKKRKEALILSIVNIIFLSMIVEIPLFYYLIYLIYYFINNKKYLIIIKAFFTSFVYFLYFEHITIELGYIVFIILYFYILLEFTYKKLKR